MIERIVALIKRIRSMFFYQIEIREAAFRQRRIGCVIEAAENVPVVIPFETIAMRHHGIDRRREHVLVGGPRVGAVLAGEGDPAAAENSDAAGVWTLTGSPGDAFVKTLGS